MAVTSSPLLPPPPLLLLLLLAFIATRAQDRRSQRGAARASAKRAVSWEREKRQEGRKEEAGAQQGPLVRLAGCRRRL